MLKFQSATKFVKLGQSCQLPCQFHHGRQCPHKVWLKSDEKCRKSSILKFLSTIYGPVLTKISKCHKFFFKLADWQKVIACIPPDYHTFYKVWLKLDENWDGGGGSSLMQILTSEILQSAPNDAKLNSN